MSSAKLRAALHAGPSTRSWRAVCAAFDQVAEPARLTELLALADKHLASWPKVLRQAPVHWWLSVLAGPEPRWSLVRALSLPPDDPRLRELTGGALARTLGEHPSTRQLTALALPGRGLEAEALALLLASPRLVQLEALDLSHNPLGLAGARALARGARLPSLLRLDLAATALEGAALPPLLAGLPQLRALVLAQNPLGPEGWTLLADARAAERVEELDLSATGGGDAGAAALAASAHLPRLGRLTLAGCQLGSRGALALAESSRLTSLALLDLAGNAIDLAAAERLVTRGLERWAWLGLRNNPLAPDEQQALLGRAVGSTLALEV